MWLICRRVCAKEKRHECLSARWSGLGGPQAGVNARTCEHPFCAECFRQSPFCGGQWRRLSKLIPSPFPLPPRHSRRVTPSGLVLTSNLFRHRLSCRYFVVARMQKIEAVPSVDREETWSTAAKARHHHRTPLTKRGVVPLVEILRAARAPGFQAL